MIWSHVIHSWIATYQYNIVSAKNSASFSAQLYKLLLACSFHPIILSYRNICWSIQTFGSACEPFNFPRVWSIIWYHPVCFDLDTGQYYRGRWLVWKYWSQFEKLSSVWILKRKLLNACRKKQRQQLLDNFWLSESSHDYGVRITSSEELAYFVWYAYRRYIANRRYTMQFA